MALLPTINHLLEVAPQVVARNIGIRIWGRLPFIVCVTPLARNKSNVRADGHRAMGDQAKGSGTSKIKGAIRP